MTHTHFIWINTVMYFSQCKGRGGKQRRIERNIERNRGQVIRDATLLSPI